MFYPPSLIKEIHEDRLRELGILPRRQLVEFPVYWPFPKWRVSVQMVVRVVVLVMLNVIRRA